MPRYKWVTLSNGAHRLSCIMGEHYPCSQHRFSLSCTRNFSHENLWALFILFPCTSRISLKHKDIYKTIFSSLTKKDTEILFPEVSCFPTHLAVLPVSQFFLSQWQYLDWFLEGTLLSSAILPVISVLQRTIQVFSECAGSTWGPYLSEELHPATGLMGSGRSGELQWYSSCAGAAAPLGSRHFWQHLCLSY